MLKHAGDSWGSSERGPVGAPVETYLFSNWFWLMLILGCDNLNREVQLFICCYFPVVVSDFHGNDIVPFGS